MIPSPFSAAQEGAERLHLYVLAGVPAMVRQVWTEGRWALVGGPWAVDVTADPSALGASASGDGFAWPSWSAGAAANQAAEAQVWSWKLDGSGGSGLALDLSGAILGDLRLVVDGVIGTGTSHTNAQILGGLHGGAAGSAGGMWGGWGRINTGALHGAGAVDNATINLTASNRGGPVVSVGYALAGTLLGDSARAQASATTFTSLNPGTPAGSLSTPRFSLSFWRGSTASGNAASATGVTADLYVPLGSL